MNAQVAVQKFFDLALEAQRIDSECYEQSVEPAFEAVLLHVLENPALRGDFVAAFIRVAHDPRLGPPELIEYCMHAIRWDEVRRHLLDWLSSEPSERVRHVLRKMLMAFDDDWKDADAYVRFGGPQL